MKKNEKIKKSVVIISFIIFLLQLIPYQITIDNLVSAEPDVVDNGDNTMTATWDFFNPNDYILNNTTMAGGEVALELSEFWWNQTSQGDFNTTGSNFVNTTATSSGDVRLISTQNTTNLLLNGSFTSGPSVWNYIPSGNITSKLNTSSGSAMMNFSYIPKGLGTLPIFSSQDGYVYLETLSVPPDYHRDPMADMANVGWEDKLGVDFYYRAFFYYDLSLIPDDSHILEVIFYTYLLDSGGSSHETDIHALDNVSTQGDEDLYIDCANGTLYFDDSTYFNSSSPPGVYEWNLGEIGKQDVKNNLSRDWFGLGLHEEGDNDDRATITTSKYAELSKRPTLNITFTESQPISFNETAYINQTFTKTKVTPDVSDAVNLSFDYALENITNVDDAKLIIEIDGQKVWNHTITGNETWNSDYAHIGKFMTEARTYNISLQLQANVSSANTVICQAKFDNLNITTLDFYWDGKYTSFIYNAGSDVLWNIISWSFTLPPDTDFSIRYRTSIDNITWSNWSDEYLNPPLQLSPPTGRYFQYTVNLSTTNYQNTPLLHDVSISYWKYRLNGTIEMMDDFRPGDYISAELVDWGDFVREDQTFGDNINITYWYTINSGLNWTEVPFDGNLSNVPISSGMIRFRATFTTDNPSISPTLFKWNLTYAIGEAAALEGDVDPGFGYITTWFNFTANYSDPEDDAPLNDIVILNITDGPSGLGIQNMFPLDPNDDNYMDGKIYYFNTTGFERGKYTFHFEAQDEIGFWSISGPGKFQVINSPPKIITTNDQGADEQELYYVDYTATDLEDEDNLTWSHSSNATWLSMNPTTGELQGIPTSADKGYFWVKVTVIDGHGGLDWTNFTLWVGDDILPIADAGFDDEVFKDSPYTFNGSNSWDNSGISNLNYTWFFGDGSKGYGPTPTHVYNQSGLHNVFLFVTDPSGNDAWAMVNIIVKNSPPVADAGPDQTVFEGETVFFDGSNSYDTASDIDYLVYTWDLNEDGNFDYYGVTSSKTWYNEDEVTVTLRVRDREFASDTDTMIVTIQNVAPTVDIGDNYKGPKGSDITFIALASDPGDDTLLFQWDWENDGVWDTGWSSDIIVKHTWSTIGNFIVKVRVSDGVDYDEDTAVVSITERKEPPIIGNLGTVQVRYNDPYVIDLANYVSDADTDLEDLIVWTNDTQNITVNGLKITLNYSWEVRGKTIKVNVFVSDGDQFDNSTLGIEVTANYPPTLINPIPNVEFFEDNISLNVFNLNHYFEDSDGEKLEFLISYTSQYLIVIKDENGWITFRASPNWAGTELVIFRAEDPNGAYKEDMILVSVIAVNDAPFILGQITYTTIEEDENWTINLNRYFIDIDSPLEFSCNKPEIKIDQLNGTATWIPGRNKELNNVIFYANDGEYNVSLDPVDLKVFTPTPFNWLLVVLPFILGLLAFAIYREIRYRYTVEEVFLVDNAGVLLVHMSRGESKAIDAKLVSGMLTAVQEFVKDSFRGANEVEDTSSEEGALGKLEYGDFQIVMERGSYTFLSAVISGYDNKRLRKRMRDVVDEFEKQYNDILVDWDGDMSKFDGAEKIVGTLLKKAGNSNMSSDTSVSEIEDTGSGDSDRLPFDDLSDVPSTYDDSEVGNMPEGGFGDSQRGSESSINNKDKDMSDSMESNEEDSYLPPPPDD